MGAVTSGEGTPLMVTSLADEALEGRSEKGVVTVYQKHRSMQTRKWKYRG